MNQAFIDAQNLRLGKILFPTRNKRSSLYRNLAPQYFDCLDRKDVKAKIIYRKPTK